VFQPPTGSVPGVPCPLLPDGVSIPLARPRIWALTQGKARRQRGRCRRNTLTHIYSPIVGRALDCRGVNWYVNPMSKKFGAELRNARRQKEKTLGDVSRLLGVSVPFVSAVENGKRNPLSATQILAVCQMLGESPELLLKLASEGRNEIKFDLARMKPKESEVALALQRGGIDDETLESMLGLIRAKGIK
jgi:HTH-type transcriptional regulator, competence development regulator